MNKENKNLFMMTNDKGEKIECEVVLTIDSEEFGKSYIVYTDHTLDDAGNIKTYASIYDPTGASLDLNPVTTDEEWDMIEAVLASAQKQVLKDEMNSQEGEEN
ncbi:MAG TPA: hypothetical protein DCY94_00865 [Firmicutes bacterium]|nr:hypothetical protein [Bacillota bacterium]